MKKTNNKIIIVVVALYLLCQIIADITAVKMTTIFGITIPAATFIYALSFTARDLAHKQLGKKDTLTLIYVAAGVNIIMAAYFIFSVYLPPAPFWNGQESYAQTLMTVPRIAFASILAELLSQLMDTYVYQKVYDSKKNYPQIIRVLLSNLVSTPLDSAVFILVAFTGNTPADVIWQLIIGQTLFKWVIGLISSPLIYVIPENKEAMTTEMTE